MDQNKIRKIQGELARQGIDGWLFYDFHGYNHIAVRFLALRGLITRRSFYFVPASGTPVAFINAVEKHIFKHLPGDKIYYSSYRILEEKLASTLRGVKRLAMEYSPGGRLPYIGRVDAGTLELIRSFGSEIVSSTDLVATFDARLNDAQAESHRRAAGEVNRIKDAAFELIKNRLSSGDTITEYDVVTFILEQFKTAGMVADHPPICAVGVNGGNPHYEPTPDQTAVIGKNQLVLIDLWAKFNNSDGVYGDITWMGYTGTDIPEEYLGHFTLLTMARDAAVKFLTETWGKRAIFGYEVDDVCRNVIAADNLDRFFSHRTGHSITDNVHGDGPNIDNLETEDRRRLLPGHLFSIEPGVYFDDFGLRTEIDVFITENGPEVTTQPIQTDIIKLV